MDNNGLIKVLKQPGEAHNTTVNHFKLLYPYCAFRKFKKQI